MARNESVPLVSERDIVLARQTVRKAALQLGFSLVDQTKIVTAASELARNAVVYGGGGRLELEIVAENGRQGLRLTISDEGQGNRGFDLGDERRMDDRYRVRDGPARHQASGQRVQDHFAARGRNNGDCNALEIGRRADGCASAKVNRDYRS